MKTTIGAAMAGGNPKDGREKNDFYPTPPECTEALMAYEQEFIRAHQPFDAIWEPACGDGAITRVLLDHEFGVISTDIADLYAFGLSGVDFLEGEPLHTGRPIITNPPFNLAHKFIERALGDCDAPYLALLLKSTYWHAARRYTLFTDYPPSVVYPLTWRPDFMNKGAPTMDCSWMVWDRKRPGTQYIPMRKASGGR